MRIRWHYIWLCASLSLLAGIGQDHASAQRPQREPTQFISSHGDVLWGFVDKSGQMKISASYKLVRDFSENLAAVSRNGESWGFINKEGKEVIPMRFQTCGDFSEGLASVGLSSGANFIDKDGHLVFEKNFEATGNFNEGIAPVKRYSSQDWCFIDRQGNVLMPASGPDDRSGEGLVIFQSKDGICGYRNQKGEVVIEPQFDGADLFHNERAWVSKNGQCFYIDKNGKRVTAVYEMTACNPYSEGLAFISVNNKHGYIDANGKVQIDARFTETASFSDGLAMVRFGRKTGYLSKEGRLVITPAYFVGSDFAEGHAWIRKYGKYGLIDKSGVMIVAPQFLEAQRFSGGLAAVAVPTSPANDLRWTTE